MTTQSLAAAWSRANSAVRMLRAIMRNSQVARSRRALHHLDDHLLRDVGLTRHQAETEATRAPWDVPSDWRS